VVLEFKAHAAGGVKPATSFDSLFMLWAQFFMACNLQEKKLNKIKKKTNN